MAVEDTAAGIPTALAKLDGGLWRGGAAVPEVVLKLLGVLRAFVLSS